MNIFDIVGPVMVGPSSSHTAGAVRIGLMSKKLMNEDIVKAEIKLHGSFFATGKGHGTDLALVAGLLGMKEDDERIPNSFKLADALGLQYSFSGIILRDAHPNSVLLNLIGASGKTLEIIASSLGGGRIKINQIDGMEVDITCEYPTLIVQNIDEPGHIAMVTSALKDMFVNIAQMKLNRQNRGGNAVMVIECDQELPPETIRWLQNSEGVMRVLYLSLKGLV